MKETKFVSTNGSVCQITRYGVSNYVNIDLRSCGVYATNFLYDDLILLRNAIDEFLKKPDIKRTSPIQL